MHDRDIFDEEDCEWVLETIKKIAIETGEIKTLTYNLEIPEGTKWFETRIMRIDDNIGGKQAVVWIARDVTDLKDYEHQL